ncbi:MAG TPA: hypothetical protein VFU05_12235 [Cyclobacteriaceae bacterium]|nr:hypothetical protein [Cyclobacteriaceae bacterium]
MNSTRIDDFFSRYALSMNSALFDAEVDLQPITDSFSGYVVGANPFGVFGGSNSDAFKNSILEGVKSYKKMGIISMNIQSTEVTMLNEFHAMVKVNWKSFYEKNGKTGEIPFENIYLIQLLNNIPRIFAFITGDEQTELRKHNLIS